MIKKGDIIKMLAGKDRGKTGKVTKIDNKSCKAAVEGLNMYKKHIRPKRQGEKGEVVQVAKAVHLSNLQLICPNCHKPARVGYKTEGGIKRRFCKKCGSRI